VPQLQGCACPVRPLGLHKGGVAGGHPRDPARLPRGSARYVARAEREEALCRRQEKALFRLLAPIVFRINELILEDRVRVKELTERLAQGQSVTPEDQAWLTELAVKSQVLEATSKRLDSDAFPQLLMRVDVVPPSLSLAPKASPRFDKQPTPPSESSLSFLLWSIVRAIAGNTQERGGLSTLEGQAKLLCFQ